MYLAFECVSVPLMYGGQAVVSPTEELCQTDFITVTRE